MKKYLLCFLTVLFMCFSMTATAMERHVGFPVTMKNVVVKVHFVNSEATPDVDEQWYSDVAVVIGDVLAHWNITVSDSREVWDKFASDYGKKRLEHTDANQLFDKYLNEHYDGILDVFINKYGFDGMFGGGDVAVSLMLYQAGMKLPVYQNSCEYTEKNGETRFQLLTKCLEDMLL